jgi:hypothetical protein
VYARPTTKAYNKIITALYFKNNPDILKIFSVLK